METVRKEFRSQPKLNCNLNKFIIWFPLRVFRFWTFSKSNTKSKNCRLKHVAENKNSFFSPFPSKLNVWRNSAILLFYCLYHPDYHVLLLKPSWRTRNSKLHHNFNMLFQNSNYTVIHVKHSLSLSLDKIYLVIDCICALQLVCTKQKITMAFFI